MKYSIWTKLSVALLVLLALTACPGPNTVTPKKPSFTLNLSEAAPGTAVIATLKNMTGIGATVQVAQKPVRIVSTKKESVSFIIPNVEENLYGEREVVIKSGDDTAKNTIKIVRRSTFILDKRRVTPSEKVTATVSAIYLQGAAVYLGEKKLPIEILNKSSFSFIVPAEAEVGLQKVILQPKDGRALKVNIEILGKVKKGKIAIMIKPGELDAAKAALAKLGFDVSGILSKLGTQGSCAGEFAEIDVGNIPLGQALAFLEKEESIMFVDPVAEWWTGSVDHIGAIGSNIANDRRGLTGKGTVIAILDTGVYDKTSELGDRILKNIGYNFVSNNNNFNDDFDDPLTKNIKLDGHGTPIAVLAAGEELGVAPDAKILPIKVCDKNGVCLSSNVIRGVCHALEKAPDRKKLVLNLSLGGDTPVLALEAILRYAINEGALIAAAGGNQGLQGSPKHYPAAFILEGLVSVAALKQDIRKWSPSDFSTRGNIDISAPGEDLKSVAANPEYPIVEGYRGTSFATPLVAGALAIWREAKPNMSPSEIETGLKDSAANLVKKGCPASVCTPEAVGEGMLDLSLKPTK